MSKIEQLENELRQKTQELNVSLNTQYLLRQALKSNTKTLSEIECMLKAVETNLNCSNEYVRCLEQENRSLKLSCGGWMKRAINLEFKVLRARDATK